VSAVADAPAVENSAAAGMEIDPASAWRLHPQVSVRPERFGALLYHFGTRKLSFLKSRTLAAVVESLSGHQDVRAALRANGVDEKQERRYLQALGLLVTSRMLIEMDFREESE
jgi:putative mycofactocin binding protein MftB